MTLPADVDRSPASQDSLIPRGWKPTPKEPIPVMRCSHIYKDGDKHGRDGERCNRWSLRGYYKCWTHSGKGGLENVNTFKQNVIEANYLRLYGSLEQATDWLLDIAENANSEAVRLKAIEDIHAMCGMRAGADLNVTITTTDNPADLLQDRLRALRERVSHPVIEAEPQESVTVSASADTDQPEEPLDGD